MSGQQPVGVDILVRHCDVVTLDAAATVLRDGAIAIATAASPGSARSPRPPASPPGTWWTPAAASSCRG